MFGLTSDIDERRGDLEDFYSNSPAINGCMVELITRSLYDRGYGIFDHGNTKEPRPLSLVAQFDSEDIVEGGYLFSLIRSFHHFKLNKKFGITLTEFLAYPRHVTDLLFDISKADDRLREKSLSDVDSKLSEDLDD